MINAHYARRPKVCYVTETRVPDTKAGNTQWPIASEHQGRWGVSSRCYTPQYEGQHRFVIPT